ncbi:MAG: DUF3052 domain-containing protein [Actinomycetota bacterium]|nr:DUF3052 domain-containing protein [Actinomycetota bacterium]
MGDEARCTARFRDGVSEGTALLETDELVFRGDFRLAIPLRDVRSVAAQDGRLTVAFADGAVELELGGSAERWAEKIRKPKGLLDKLGVRPDSRVALVGVDDEVFRRALVERVGAFADGEPNEEVELVFLGARSRDDLRRLVPLQRSLARDGAIWVVAPKGGREPREADVLAAGKEAELVDVKVARFSDTHTAHKFVIPKTRR